MPQYYNMMDEEETTHPLCLVLAVHQTLFILDTTDSLLLWHQHLSFSVSP